MLRSVNLRREAMIGISKCINKLQENQDIAIVKKIGKELEDYKREMAIARDKLWPNLKSGIQKLFAPAGLGSGLITSRTG
jgi:hypothetical protein